MVDLELTSEEKKELEKRGFFAKNIINKFTIFIYEIKISTLLSIIIFGNVGLLYVATLFTLIYGFILILIIFSNWMLLIDIKKMYQYIKSSIEIGTLFYGTDGIICFQENYTKNNKDMLALLYRKTNDIIVINKDTILKKHVEFGMLLFMVSIFLVTTYYTPDLLFPREYILYGTLFIIVSILVTYSVLHFIKINFYSSNPLYAFGNLGEKIQSLTPKISEQSKQIESEFRGDMDFRVLSKSFASLASTFSQIVNLVVKLEQVEKKANKGDLFDSAKYINSLREDIRTPLLSLKTFLETKRQELRVSQEELMRVRVSVGGEGSNRELQSMRTNELLKELDENIVKIGEMIERL